MGDKVDRLVASMIASKPHSPADWVYGVDIASGESRITSTILCLCPSTMNSQQPPDVLSSYCEERGYENLQFIEDETTELDRFNEWFPAAREQGLVLASRQESGEILVLTSDEEWVNFQQFLETHPST